MKATTRSKPLPEWHAHKYNPTDRSAIAERLRAFKAEIAETLQIGPEEYEAAVPPGSKVDAPSTRSFEDIIAVRNDFSRVTMVPRIDLVLEDLTTILIAYLADLSNVNAIASAPRVYMTLKALTKRSEISEDEVRLLDPGVRSLLAIHYPGGRQNFAPGLVQFEDVRAAATAALATLPKPGRGRPKGSSNAAAHRLAKELAIFYENNSPARPGRHVVVNTTLDTSLANSCESGAFYKFCKLAIAALPPSARDKVTRDGGDIANLLRSALSRNTAA